MQLKLAVLNLSSQNKDTCPTQVREQPLSRSLILRRVSEVQGNWLPVDQPLCEAVERSLAGQLVRMPTGRLLFQGAPGKTDREETSGPNEDLLQD